MTKKQMDKILAHGGVATGLSVKDLAYFLEQRRQQLGMTRRCLARRAQISEHKLRNVLRGDPKRVTFGEASRVAIAVGGYLNIDI